MRLLRFHYFGIPQQSFSRLDRGYCNMRQGLVQNVKNDAIRGEATLRPQYKMENKNNTRDESKQPK